MPDPTRLRVADLPQNAETGFDLRPDADALQVLAADLGLIGLRKLRFAGRLRGHGRRDWALSGRLGATVVQPCVVTLEPVTTRIDTDVTRLYVAGVDAPAESEVEMPEDDSVEPLGPFIDLAAVMAEALTLALPLYPRKKDAALAEAVFAGPSQTPMRDADARPFAGLAGLRDKLQE